ncbi:MAG: Uma2 family endonuclease [Singulisphaera sp.]
MATITCRIGPRDLGRRMSLDEFIEADFEDGWLYELARGVIVVTHVPRSHHGRIVLRCSDLFARYHFAHPGVIDYRAWGSECRLRMPGMQSDRHPDLAIYLDPEPQESQTWTQWVPDIVVEVVSRRGERRDYVEKREEYLTAGVTEYWILDPKPRTLLVLQRAGDVWLEVLFKADETYRTHLLPGLEVRPGELLGLAEAG